jgi:hypothetical protein
MAKTMASLAVLARPIEEGAPEDNGRRRPYRRGIQPRSAGQDVETILGCPA